MPDSREFSEPTLALRLFLAGLSNCVAATCSNPIDVVKVRLQINGELNQVASLYTGWLNALAQIVREEGAPRMHFNKSTRKCCNTPFVVPSRLPRAHAWVGASHVEGELLLRH
jgi:hypothetical protein